MKPKDISQLIGKEINGDWTISNRHGCEPKKCLIRLKKRKLRSGGEIKDYWIVLEEIPEMLEGWKVFFDEETKEFGLAGHSDPVGYVANFHDTFIAAFKSM